MNKYEDIIIPLKSLWPDYNYSCYQSDYINTIYINSNKIPEMVIAINDYNANSTKTRLCKMKLKNMLRNVKKKFIKTVTPRSARAIKFAKTKVLLDEYKEISIEKLFSKIIDKVIKAQPFTVKLQHKLLIDKNT
mmetsp:Transcript_18929/g.21197  ORF Transcript_18929/g.21197 Transcript_18929/m.21197 type:complete len:134 (-) Transcript_18929:2-403(-)